MRQLLVITAVLLTYGLTALPAQARPVSYPSGMMRAALLALPQIGRRGVISFRPLPSIGSAGTMATRRFIMAALALRPMLPGRARCTHGL